MVKTDQAVSIICLRLVISNSKTVTKTVTHVECAGAMKMFSLAELSWTEDRAGRDQAHRHQIEHGRRLSADDFTITAHWAALAVVP